MLSGTSESTGGTGIWRQRLLLGVGILILIAAVVVGWRVLRGAGANTRAASDRMFMCADCGKIFEHTISVGEAEPIECPKCGKNSAWLAEKCYWTKDGKAKLEPTYVILKKRMGIDEKTYCPDCGREVRGHNPLPPKEVMDAARAAAGG